MDKIDNLDRKILSILSKNARIPFKDVAAECGVSRAAIHQRVQHLIQGGVIVGSGFEVNPKSVGYSTCTYVGLNLERGSMYKDVVKQLVEYARSVEKERGKNFCFTLTTNGRGFQYTGRVFRQKLVQAGMTQSMSRVLRVVLTTIPWKASGIS